MRAVVVRRSGGPEVLEIGDRPAPRAGPGQLVVRVAAVGVNFRDIYERQGRPPYASDPPYVPGVEGAGTVTAVGQGVDGFAEGDTVAWADAGGSYAEQVAVPAARAVPVPQGLDPQLAAAVMLQGMTAHYLCGDTYPVAAGDPVVVHAAAGGVGLLLTQMVKLRGGIVVATTSTSEKAALARRAGADRLAGYDDFGAAVREVAGGGGAAVVYDGVGQATFDASLQALRPRGYMVLYGAASGPVAPVDPQRLLVGGSLYLTRPTLGSYVADRGELLARAGELFGWIGQGRLEVSIGATYPLDQAGKAQDDLAARRTTGKLLLLPA